MKNFYLLLMGVFIISCNNVTSPSQTVNSEAKITASSETELAKLKLIKHEQLNINKDFAKSENKEELEKLKKEFNCSSVSYPPEYFGGFSPEKSLSVCSTYTETVNLVFNYKTTYLVKENDNKYKQYQNIKDIFSPVDSKEEALAFAVSMTDYKINNNLKDVKDLLKNHELESGNPNYRLRVKNFLFKDNLKVFTNQINETSVETDENGNYKVNLFLYDANLQMVPNIDYSCKPILWEVIVQVDKTGDIKELSKTKILEDGRIEDCVGGVV